MFTGNSALKSNFRKYTYFKHFLFGKLRARVREIRSIPL